MLFASCKGVRSLLIYILGKLGGLAEVRDPLIESPEDAVTRFTYDEAGNVLTETDRKGQVTRHTYDHLNRLKETNHLADGMLEGPTYNLFGNVATLANFNIGYTFTYDNPNRISS